MSNRDPFARTPASPVDPLTPTGEQGSTNEAERFEDGVNDPATWTSSEYLEGVQNRDGGSNASGSGMTGQAKQKSGEMAGQAQEKAGKAADKAQEMAGQAQDKASEMGHMAQEKADAGMDAAASGLGQAASMLREQGEQREGTVGTAAGRAAETLDSASSYLQHKDTNQVLDDVEAFVRQRPVESVLIAAGIGFVLSKIVK